MEYQKGFDTSRYEMWTDGFAGAVLAGYLFGATCATQGDYLVDPTFNGFKDNPDGIQYGQYWPKLKKAGLFRVAYHVLSPERDVNRQMDLFFKVLGDDIEATDRISLDAEIARGCDAKTVTKQTYGCLKLIEQRTGKKGILYTAPSWADRYLLADEYIMSHDRWIANYENPGGPALPKIFRNDYEIWQWTEAGVIAGTRDKIDLNHFKGSKEELLKFFGAATLPPPPVNPCGCKNFVPIT